MDFEKAKRDGAKAGLADTIKDCKTAGKTEAECKADAEIAFAESMGLDKTAGDFKAEYELFKTREAAGVVARCQLVLSTRRNTISLLHGYSNTPSW